MAVQHLDLPVSSIGTQRRLAIHRLGAPGARPKAYLQAALHADELPGALVLHHLVRLLAGADIIGEIVVIPLANPIGLDQHMMGYPLGRYDLALMSNFNRGWPHLTQSAAARVDGRLGDDAPINIDLVREALGAEVAGLPAMGENTWMRRALLGLAVDADYVLDLHSDLEAVPHLYLAEALWPDAADVGGVPAEADAAALLRFLIRRGVVRGQAGGLPDAQCAATPLDRAAMVRAEVAAILDYLVAPGDEVQEGQTLARLVDPVGGDVAEVTAPTAGVVFARERARFARPGTVIAKIAGVDPLPGRGALLPD